MLPPVYSFDDSLVVEACQKVVRVDDLWQLTLRKLKEIFDQTLSSLLMSAELRERNLARLWSLPTLRSLRTGSSTPVYMAPKTLVRLPGSEPRILPRLSEGE